MELLIIGASARAAAGSALRGGLCPVAVDAFGDVDLVRRCPADRCADYPSRLPDAVAGLPRLPFLYTGALENRPDILTSVARHHELLGNGPAELRRVRDPFELARALRRGGFSVPDALPATLPVPPGRGRFLRKPVASRGGHGIQFARRRGTAAAEHPATPAYYWQQYVPGPSFAAIYLAGGGRTLLVGVTRQWSGRERAGLGAAAFAYAGSCTCRRWPCPASDLHALGEFLAGQFHLRGLFGVDFILNRRRIWTVEVNPRYTASCELLERQHGISLVAWHVEACRSGRLPRHVPAGVTRRLLGKAIVVAPEPLAISPAFVDACWNVNARRAWPPVADIPPTNSVVPAGAPLVTVYATARRQMDVWLRLRNRREAILRLAAGNEPSPDAPGGSPSPRITGRP